jgi:hypothetical protein
MQAHPGGRVIEPKIEVLDGAQFDPHSATLLVASPSLATNGDLGARAQLTLTFLSVAIPTGLVVRSNCYIASTGARVEMQIDGGRFSQWSQGRSLKTQSKVVSTTKLLMKLAPKGSYKTKDAGEASLSVGEFQRQRGASLTTEFAAKEYPVAASGTGDFVRWSIDMHRGGKAVRDYLEGNAVLWADYRWTARKSPLVHSRVTSSDRRFFNSKKLPLGPILSLALILKLKASGTRLPSLGPIVFQISMQAPQ